MVYRYLGAYKACLLAEQRQIGKAPMQRLERKHLTMCTRLKRLTRNTICGGGLI
jgi:insertion element IS1 protein InsB